MSGESRSHAVVGVTDSKSNRSGSDRTEYTRGPVSPAITLDLLVNPPLVKPPFSGPGEKVFGK